jgi:hypothetical protein
MTDATTVLLRQAKRARGVSVQVCPPCRSRVLKNARGEPSCAVVSPRDLALEIVIDIGTISRWNDVAGELLALAASGPLGGGGGAIYQRATPHQQSRRNGTDKLVVEKVQGGVVFFSATEPNDWKAFSVTSGRQVYSSPLFAAAWWWWLAFVFCFPFRVARKVL